jgi:hypothetical protein
MRILYNNEAAEEQRSHFIPVIDAALIEAIDSLLYVGEITQTSFSNNTQVYHSHFKMKLK